MTKLPYLTTAKSQVFVLSELFQVLVIEIYPLFAEIDFKIRNIKSETPTGGPQEARWNKLHKSTSVIIMHKARQPWRLTGEKVREKKTSHEDCWVNELWGLQRQSSQNQSPEPVVRVAIWRITREVVHGQSAYSG